MTYGSLFTGIGGLDLGLDRAGFECRWQVEIDPYALKVLQRHWPNVARYGDITKLTGYELEPVDAICGGFPCQDLSQAGKQAGIEGARSGLWFEYARLIRELRPRYVLIENVPGLLIHDAMRRVIGELARLGYVGIWRSLRASEFGASHLRKRVFIVAYRECERGERWRDAGILEGAASQEYREALQRQRNGHASYDSRNDVAYGPFRGLGELRQPSGSNGLVNGRHEELGNAHNPRLEGWSDDAGEYAGQCATGTRGTGLAYAAGKRYPGDTEAGRSGEESSRQLNGTEHARGALPAFAPGPSDPRWPYILRERPDLAPALAHSGHNERHTGRRDSLQERPRQQGHAARGEPTPYGIPDDGSAAPQSPLCRMVDGIPPSMDGDPMSNRTKRLGRLGNAVVPQISEWIGHRIMEFERSYA